MTIKEREAKLVEFLSKSEPGWKVSIHSFDRVGYRISEITYSQATSKGVYFSSCMRCEPECSAIILAAENFVINCDNEEEYEELCETLEYLIRR